MPANVQPLFALVPEIKTAVITAATTDKSGAIPGNLVELVNGSLEGSKITWIKFKHVGSSTNGLYLIFITDTSGANPRLYAEMVITTITSTNTVATNENTLFTPDLQIKSGQKILVGATTAASNIHVTASIGNF